MLCTAVTKQLQVKWQIQFDKVIWNWHFKFLFQTDF